MQGYDFIFNGKSLRDFGFIMVNPDTNDDSGITKEILKGDITSVRPTANHYGTKYSKPITLYFLIIKNVCDNKYNLKINDDELRSVQKWLSSSKLPKLLQMQSFDGDVYEYFGIFNEISSKKVNGLVGLNLTFTCDSPFAYKTKTINIECTSSENQEKVILCDSDELEDYVYPIVYVNPQSRIFSFENKTEGRTMSFSLNKDYTNILIDCKSKRIIGDDHVLTLSDAGVSLTEFTDYNNINTGISKLYWFRLLPGYNDIKCSGDCNIQIEYKVPLKIGGLDHV